MPLFILIGVFLLFFPIVIDVYSHADLNRKKFTFSFYLYKKIKVYGGYVSAYPGGLAVHTAKNKVKLLPFKDMNKEQKKQMKIYRAVKFKRFLLTSETGAEYLLPIALLNVFLKTAYVSFGGRDEKLEIWASDGDVLLLSTMLCVSFNGFMVIKLLVNTIKERCKNYAGKK